MVLVTSPPCNVSYFVRGCSTASATRRVEFQESNVSACAEAGAGATVPLTGTVIACDFVPWTSAMGAGLVLLIFACVILPIGTLLWFYLHRTHKMVIGAQPRLINTFLVGNVITLLGALIFLQEPSTTTCRAIPIILGVGLTIMQGGVFLKVYRVLKVFGTERLARIRVRESEMMKILFTMLMVDFVILLSWMTTDPPELEYPKKSYAVEEYRGVIEASVRSCAYRNTFVFTYVGYKVAGMCVGCYLAFLTRNVDKRYLQSKLILVLVYHLSMIGCLLAILITSSASRPSKICGSVLAICISCVSAVGFVCVPTIIRYRSDRQAELYLKLENEGAQDTDKLHSPPTKTPALGLTSPNARKRRLGALTSKPITPNPTVLNGSVPVSVIQPKIQSKRPLSHGDLSNDSRMARLQTLLEKVKHLEEEVLDEEQENEQVQVANDDPFELPASPPDARQNICSDSSPSSLLDEGFTSHPKTFEQHRRSVTEMHEPTRVTRDLVFGQRTNSSPSRGPKARPDISIRVTLSEDAGDNDTRIPSRTPTPPSRSSLLHRVSKSVTASIPAFADFFFGTDKSHDVQEDKADYEGQSRPSLPMTQSFYANLMFSPEELARLQENLSELEQHNTRLRTENRRLKDQIDEFLNKALETPPSLDAPAKPNTFQQTDRTAHAGRSRLSRTFDKILSSRGLDEEPPAGLDSKAIKRTHSLYGKQAFHM